MIYDFPFCASAVALFHSCILHDSSELPYSVGLRGNSQLWEREREGEGVSKKEWMRMNKRESFLLKGPLISSCFSSLCYSHTAVYALDHFLVVHMPAQFSLVHRVWVFKFRIFPIYTSFPATVSKIRPFSVYEVRESF